LDDFEPVFEPDFGLEALVCIAPEVVVVADVRGLI